jgi:UDP:flavonoid glycosyltransferase YjiC (YdhE family)
MAVMAERHVLMVLHDAGGTVPPVLAVAQQLVAGGDAVTILSQASVRDRADAAGCRFVEARVPDYDRSIEIEQQLTVAFPAIAGTDLGEDVLTIAHGDDVDVVVVDPNLAGALAAAESLPCPSVVLLHSLYATFVDEWFGTLWPVLGDLINTTRAHFGRGPCDGWASLFDDHDMIISPVPATFDIPTTRAQPDQMRSFGFLVPAYSSTATAIDFATGESPAVLVGLTTTYHDHAAPTLQAIVDGLATLDVRAIVTTAGYLPDGGAPAEHIRIVDHAPHAFLLPKADVMVCHGGLGSVATALAAGVPMLCIPFSRDQPLNANRAAQLGAAVVLDEVTPAAIADAVLRILGDGSYRAAAGALAERSRREGGPRQAAAAIHALTD